MNIKKATQVLRSGHNPVEILRALDYCEKNSVVTAIETILFRRTVFMADLMDEHDNNPEKYEMFGLFTFSKIYETLSYLTVGSMGRNDPGDYNNAQEINLYIASEYFDIGVTDYLLKKSHTDTWYFENIVYWDEENNIGIHTLKNLVIVKVLERLLPFKEKIKSISITNARFERLPAIIDEYYSHLDFIKLTDCVFPEDFQHPKMIVEYSEGASHIPQPNSLKGSWFSYLDKLFEQLKRLSTNESIEINVPSYEDVMPNSKVIRSGKKLVVLEENHQVPKSMVEFYEWIKPFDFLWKLRSENANLLTQGNAHFEPYNTKLLGFETSKAQTEIEFGPWRGWCINNKPFDYQSRTFYILEKISEEAQKNIGYFGGKDSKGMIYYQKGMDFYSMGLDFHGYMYFLGITYGLRNWQSVILALSQQDETYNYHSFESSMKTINPDFNLWEFKLSYQKARITDI